MVAFDRWVRVNREYVHYYDLVINRIKIVNQVCRCRFDFAWQSLRAQTTLWLDRGLLLRFVPFFLRGLGRGWCAACLRAPGQAGRYPLALLLHGSGLKGFAMLFRVVGTVIVIFDFAAVIRLLFADRSDVDWMCPETGRFLTVTFVLLVLLGMLEYVLFFVTGQVV